VSAATPTQTRRFHSRVASSVVADSCAAYASDQTPLLTVTPTKLRTSGISPRDRFRTAYTAKENDASAATSSGTVYGVGCHTIDTGCMTVPGKRNRTECPNTAAKPRNVCSNRAIPHPRSHCPTSTATPSLSTRRGALHGRLLLPRADTPGCTTEACSFRDEWDAFEGADVAVVGISDDSVGDLEPFAEEYDLPFTLLSDPDGEGRERLRLVRRKTDVR